MKVLVACEFSGVVRDAFLARDHDAVSCDLLPTEAPGPHVQADVLEILDYGWDLMIAHPPCTYICRNANRHVVAKNTTDERDAGITMFQQMLNAPIPRICVENPVPSAFLRDLVGKYTQIIQPWQFGHDYSKKTCLWLRGLPKLEPTRIVDISYHTTTSGHRYTAGWYKTPRNSKDRSRSFTGIAEAMADQWGSL